MSPNKCNIRVTPETLAAAKQLKQRLDPRNAMTDVIYTAVCYKLMAMDKEAAEAMRQERGRSQHATAIAVHRTTAIHARKSKAKRA